MNKVRSHYLGLDHAITRKKYVDYIYLCNKSFSKESNWWFLPSSSRERLSSDVQDKLFFYYHQSTEKGNEKFLSNEFQYQNGIRKILSYLPRFKSGLSILKSFLNVLQFLLLKKEKRFNILKNQDRIAFVCPIHNLPIKIQNEKIWNPYFGELPDFYRRKNFHIDILGPLDPELMFKPSLRIKESYIIHNLLVYLSLSSLFSIIFKTFFILLKKPFLPKPTDELEKKINFFLKQEFAKSAMNIFWGKIYERAFTSYAKQNNPLFVFHTYENNWWERAINRACEGHRESIKKVIGFLHCSILESHMKYTLVNDEWHLKPSPDMIIVTGPEAKKILLDQGNYPVESIKIGFDLRGPNLSQINKKKIRPKKIEKILILLEGLNTMPSFLKLVIETLSIKNHYSVTIRCHPVYPIERAEFAEIRKHPYFNNMQISRNRSLAEDLTSAELVIYKGSTSVLYAAYSGIPVLKYVESWWASDDPLNNCKEFKQTFSDKKGLIEAIDYFERLSSAEYNYQKKVVQKFVLNYMRPYSEDKLKTFAQELIE